MPGSIGRFLLRIIGLTMILCGLGLASHYYFQFDISATTEGTPFSAPARVVNIGKTAERQAGITYWAFVSLLGVAAMYAGREQARAETPTPAKE